jgi:hypothetical protein
LEINRMIAELEGLELGLAAVVVVLVVAVVVLALQFTRLSSRFDKLKESVDATPVPEPAPQPAPVVEAKAEPVEAPQPVAVADAEVVPKAKSDLDLGNAVPDELIPILIAAAATAIGKPVRVKDVVLVQTEKPNVWGTQGRIVIQRSHNTSNHQW